MTKYIIKLKGRATICPEYIQSICARRPVTLRDGAKTCIEDWTFTTTLDPRQAIHYDTMTMAEIHALIIGEGGRHRSEIIACNPVEV
jgi:hypothetical protein